MKDKKVKLKEIANINMGQSPKGTSYNNKKLGMPFLQGNRTFGRIYPKIDTWTTEPNKIGKKNTILMSVRAPVGAINFADQDICIGRGLCSIEMKNGNNQYLYYVLMNSIQEIKRKSTGTVFEAIHRKELEEIELFNFDEKEQNKIANILFTIDKKIELNNQMNDNLFDLGDTLYKEYFESKAELPTDCKVCKLKEVASNYDSKRKPMSNREREKHPGKYPYYGATSIIDYIEDYIFDGIYLLMGEDGTVVTNDGKPVLQYIWGKTWVNNHAHVLKGRTISTEHLMFCLRNYNVRNIITGAVQPKINQENMNNISIVLGDEETNKKFEKTIHLIMKQYRSNIEQIIKLKQLRDILLPKLINGEINLE